MKDTSKSWSAIKEALHNAPARPMPEVAWEDLADRLPVKQDRGFPLRFIWLWLPLIIGISFGIGWLSNSYGPPKISAGFPLQSTSTAASVHVQSTPQQQLQQQSMISPTIITINNYLPQLKRKPHYFSLSNTPIIQHPAPSINKVKKEPVRKRVAIAKAVDQIATIDFQVTPTSIKAKPSKISQLSASADQQAIKIRKAGLRLALPFQTQFIGKETRQNSTGLRLQNRISNKISWQIGIYHSWTNANGLEADVEKIGIDLSPYSQDNYAPTDFTLNAEQWHLGLGLAYLLPIQESKFSVQMGLATYLGLGYRGDAVLTQTLQVYPATTITENIPLSSAGINLNYWSAGIELHYQVTPAFSLLLNGQYWLQGQQAVHTSPSLGFGLQYQFWAGLRLLNNQPRFRRRAFVNTKQLPCLNSPYQLL